MSASVGDAWASLGWRPRQLDRHTARVTTPPRITPRDHRAPVSTERKSTAIICTCNMCNWWTIAEGVHEPVYFIGCMLNLLHLHPVFKAATFREVGGDCACTEPR